MKRILISATLAFIVGFTTSRFFSNRTKLAGGSDSSSTLCLDLTDAKSNLMTISQNEYLEYTKIKDLKQKYEKADELLGKIMLLFLADVGFRLQKDVVVQPASAGSLPATLKPDENLTASASPILSKEASSEKLTSQNDSTLKSKSAAIKNLQSEKQIRDLLDQAIVENPKIDIVNGQSPSHQQARILEGKYFGTIKYLDRKRENLNVIWDLMPDYSKSGLSGEFTLRIYGSGSKNSESNGRGDLDNIVSLADDKDGFLVAGCGGDCHLQLYYNAPANQFYGNFYELNKEFKKSTRVGLVELKK